VEDKKEGCVGGELDGVVVGDAVEAVTAEERRLRNGILGRR
jgi:hypothetical protein